MTHIGSGLSVARGAKMRKHADALVSDIVDLVDWELSQKELVIETRPLRSKFVALIAKHGMVRDG